MFAVDRKRRDVELKVLEIQLYSVFRMAFPLKYVFFALSCIYDILLDKQHLSVIVAPFHLSIYSIVSASLGTSYALISISFSIDHSLISFASRLIFHFHFHFLGAETTVRSPLSFRNWPGTVQRVGGRGHTYKRVSYSDCTYNTVLHCIILYCIVL